MLYLRNAVFVALIALCCFSCREKEAAAPVTTPSGATYFSIKDFARDQWETFHGKPLMLVEYTTVNGKTDSNVVSALTMKWSEVFKRFFETDIGDPKFLERYNFEMFEEEATQTRTFAYTAKEPELFTQKLQIAADAYTNKIRNVYVETQKQSFWSTKTQKLLYSPMRVVQMQEHTDPLIGFQKDVVVEYKFL